MSIALSLGRAPCTTWLVRQREAVGRDDEAAACAGALLAAPARALPGVAPACGLLHLDGHDRRRHALDGLRDGLRVRVEQASVRSVGRSRSRAAAGTGREECEGCSWRTCCLTPPRSRKVHRDGWRLGLQTPDSIAQQPAPHRLTWSPGSSEPRIQSRSRPRRIVLRGAPGLQTPDSIAQQAAPHRSYVEPRVFRPGGHRFRRAEATNSSNSSREVAL